MASAMYDSSKPTPFSLYLEEKRKLVEAAEEHPDLPIDSSPKKVVGELKSSHNRTRTGSRIGTPKSTAKAGFVDRVQERLSTPSGASGVAFYNQGNASGADGKKGTTTRASDTQEDAFNEAVGELAAAAKKLATSTSARGGGGSAGGGGVSGEGGGISIAGRAATPLSSSVSPVRPSAVEPTKVKPSSVSANPPLSPVPHATAYGPPGTGSMRPFSQGSERLNQRLSTPKFSPVSPGLILSQQSTAVRSGSGSAPPQTPGGSIVHAMEASRASVSSQGRPATGVLVTAGGSRAGTGAGRPESVDPAAKMAAHRRKMTLATMSREGTITEDEFKDHQQRQRFNAVVAKLRERIQSNGYNNLGSHFSALDVNKNGVLEPNEFKKALLELNLGYDVDDFVFQSLLNAADLNKDSRINYAEFTQALRNGKLAYMPLNPNIKTRTLPDPDNPFGDPNMDMKLPFGIQSDALSNIQAYDDRINNLYKNLEETFIEFDGDNSGEVDWKEFKAAMSKLVKKQNIHLSDEEIKELFRSADLDHSGAINWAEFVRSFQGGARKRFIPEFLKPKSMRCSMLGAPWEWVVDPEAVDSMCNSVDLLKVDAAVSTADNAPSGEE